MISEDFPKELTKKREDSSLRWPANVYHTTTHNDRISWLLFENKALFENLGISLFVKIATLKYTLKRKNHVSTKEQEELQRALFLWKDIINHEDYMTELELSHWKTYLYKGD